MPLKLNNCAKAPHRQDNQMYISPQPTCRAERNLACSKSSAPPPPFRASGARALRPGQEFYKAALGARWPAEKVRPPREPASSLRFWPLRVLLPPGLLRYSSLRGLMPPESR